MKKYLEDLRKELKNNGLNDFDIQDIIDDLCQMIQEAKNEGLNDEDIPNKFGKPEDLARDLAKDSKGDEENTTKYSDILLTSTSARKIEIRLINEDIIIKQSKNNEFEIYGENIIKSNYIIKEDHNCISIERKMGFLSKIKSFSQSGESFTIKVPKVQLDLVNINSKSSDANIEDLDLVDLNLNTISGDYKIRNVHGDSFKVKNISGDIILDEISFDSMSVSNVSGDFSIKKAHIKNQLNINTVSGDYKVNDSDTKDLTYHSVSGDFIGQEFYPESVSLKSVSGDIKIINKDHDRKITIKSKKSLSGDISI
ncbi:DUF4097 domain-containing protein [Hujiaoplasma nucleasis]|uniref:DUF4097 domain-containing protein n=1 Tax=Hujiaoplasma nucleasis TaxID=2725268 RepID=A0A7L6N3R2_9MOLU|nr:DUF4097 family beta strand repeat-containing protein [Hujiaoplasma nucleasis]QLY40896.1 DUF4097 domain-containing protein [Hujiaoplasma nucleasis]